MTSLGFFNVDKPAGMTSHDVVSVIRRGTNTKKVGHAGTLDPMATGVLVICWGKATRLSNYVMSGQKSYTAIVTLGIETDTYDAEGHVVAERKVPISREVFEASLDAFRGPIQQVPPMYSAIKKGGKKLYELARAGETIDREPRSVTIYALELLSFDFPKAHLHVTCSSGTYIRSIAHDIGQTLGVGGHLSMLRRTAVSDQFTLDTAIPLDVLREHFEIGDWQQHLLSTDFALSHMQRVDLSAEDSVIVANGGFVELDGSIDGHPVLAYNPVGEFIALLERRSETSNSWKPLKVFI